MRTVGVDFATEASKTAACVIHWTLGIARVERLEVGIDDDAVCEFDTPEFERVGVDCPFGWPGPFIAAIAAHQSFGLWPGRDLAQKTFRRTLRLRRTDEYVAETTGATPLSVSANLLGATAMRLAMILDRLAIDRAPVDRAGAGRFLEVYPAAALARWGLTSTGYKSGPDKVVALGMLVGSLQSRAPWLELPESALKLCRRSDDAFDALVAALVARTAALGLTDPPPADAASAAATEGWIHLPAGNSLEGLATAR